MEQTKINQAEELLLNSQKRLEELRELRHDLKNQFAYMKIMLDNKQYDTLARYFEEMDGIDLDRSHTFLGTIDCGNQTVNAILDMEAAKVISSGHRLETRIFLPDKLPISDRDICSLLTNLIDNAVEACNRYALAGATIDIDMHQHQDYLYISVTNPISANVDEEELLMLKTSKEDKWLHGHGSRIIDKIVKRYNGFIERTIRENRFIVNIMLDMQAEVRS